MRILLYAHTGDEDGVRLQGLLEQAAPRGSVERFDSLGSLSRSLQSSFTEPCLAVLVAKDRGEMLNIASFQSTFEGAQVVIVLPDQESEILSIAHQLRPRYLTYHSESFSDLLAVVQQKVSPDRNSAVHPSAVEGRKPPRRSHAR